MKRRVLVVLGALAVVACASGGSSVGAKRAEAPADLVLVGGTVLTQDPQRPRAEAVAIRDGRFAAVGSAEQVRALAGPGTRVVELRGGTVVPGLVDGHCHLYGLGAALEVLPLKGLTSAQAVVERVAEVARARPEGEWIAGRGWDQNLWTPAALPDREVLDKAVPGHPVVLERIDGHAVWANSLALQRAGITEKTPDPPGGRIVRDARGRPTGVLVDNAGDLVLAAMPADTPEVRERKILAAAEVAAASGLTGVHEMGVDDETVAVYRRLAAEGRLKVRVYAFLSGQPKVVASLPSRTPEVDKEGTALFTLRGVKLYADGALGSRGAALLEPYSDDPGNRGLELTSREALAEAARLAAASGWQLGIHAIGDRANRNVLDALAPYAGKGLRFRIEHAQVVSPEDLRRFAALGVAAAMQPTHATSDMPWADERLGPARLAGAYAWRTLVESGAHVVGGSDFPVEEVSPLLGLYAAVTRQDPSGHPEGGWLPEQRLTLEQALRLYTVEPAWASFVEGKRGVIAEGAVADVTVLDRELHPDKRLLDVRVLLTLVGGRVTYERRE